MLRQHAAYISTFAAAPMTELVHTSMCGQCDGEAGCMAFFFKLQRQLESKVMDGMHMLVLHTQSAASLQAVSGMVGCMLYWVALMGGDKCPSKDSFIGCM
jgi:hypothetical protein